MRDTNARPDMLSWLETRRRSELDLARQAADEKAARAHRELAKLYEAELNRAID